MCFDLPDQVPVARAIEDRRVFHISLFGGGCIRHLSAIALPQLHYHFWDDVHTILLESDLLLPLPCFASSPIFFFSALSFLYTNL
ncbi:hypothetical protein DFH06DRAFT_193246 [Mycena polygramma]|nr:hypothetical protein DFH06DRAFT_193246 [Mycena polygramma]